MWIYRTAGLVILGITLVGCTNNNDEATRDNPGDYTQPINYETNEEQDEHEGYPQSDQTGMNDGDETGQSDFYTNEETVSIAHKLSKQKEVVQAQVALTEHKVVVGVMLNDNAPPDMQETIKKQVQDMKPDKKVHVYTDDIYWDRMRNKDSKLDQFNGGMKEFLNEFFNTTRE